MSSDCVDKSSETLRQQFQLIQEQQQKRLLLRKQRKLKASEKSDDGVGAVSKEAKTNSNKEHSLGLDDDLDLKLDFNVNSNNGLQTELDELKDTVRELRDENGRLYKLLGERDEEMRLLRKKREDERKALVGNTSAAADTAAAKIVDLSKKNRELTAELEGERNRSRQLNKKIADLERQAMMAPKMGDLPTFGSFQPSLSNDNKKEQDKVDVAVLQDKISQLNSKVAEFRNQCEQMKKEMKIAHKVLSKELGEGVDVNAILNDPSSFRGRQQQIIALQNKVTDLNKQLSQGGKTSIRSTIMSPLSAGAQLDERHKSMLRKLERERKDANEKAAVELESLQEEHGKLQQKHDAAKARNKVLANELKSLKAQSKTLLEKGSHDDELIAALMRELQQVKDSTANKDNEIKHLIEQSKKIKISNENSLISELQKMCKEKEEKVKGLENELENLKLRYQQSMPSNQPAIIHKTADERSESTRLQSVGDDDEVGGSPDERPASEQGARTRTGSIGRSSTTGIPMSPSYRQVRSAKEPLSSPLPPTPPTGSRPGSNRSRRNSAGGSEEIISLRSQVHQYTAQCRAAEVERDRLSQFVAVLQNRIDESNNKSMEALNSLQQQRRINAQQEKQLARLQAAQNNKNNKTKAVKEDPSLTLYEVEDLQTRLAIQMDENDALKEALNSTLKSKEQDLRLYQDMVEQTKKIFLQGLRQFRQGSA